MKSHLQLLKTENSLEFEDFKPTEAAKHFRLLTTIIQNYGYKDKKTSSVYYLKPEIDDNSFRELKHFLFSIHPDLLNLNRLEESLILNQDQNRFLNQRENFWLAVLNDDISDRFFNRYLAFAISLDGPNNDQHINITYFLRRYKLRQNCATNLTQKIEVNRLSKRSGQYYKKWQDKLDIILSDSQELDLLTILANISGLYIV